MEFDIVINGLLEKASPSKTLPIEFSARRSRFCDLDRKQPDPGI